MKKLSYSSSGVSINKGNEFVSKISNLIKKDKDLIKTEIGGFSGQFPLSAKIKKPILVGIHLTKNGKLPSGETITEVIEKYKRSNWAGLVASCVSMEIAENSILEFKKQNLPFGFKVNLWGDDEPSPVRKINTAKYNEDAVNLNTVMGKREVSDEMFKSLGKKFIDYGATIIGGCCETNPRHISILSSLK